MRDNKRLRFIRFITLFFLVLLTISLALFVNHSRAAGEFTYSIDVDYNVPPAGPTGVYETYNITNNTSNKYLDSIKLSTPSTDLQNLRVYYVGGGSIPYTTEVVSQQSSGFKYDYTQINIDFTTAKVGYGLRWGFVLEYQTNSLVENKGRANVVYIPGISQENRDNYNVRLSVPDNFGPVHGFGSLPKEISRQAGNVSYSFSQSDLVNNSLQLLFGDSTTYKANIIYPIKNNSSLSKDYTITLPPNTSSQSAYIQKITPQPIKTSLDADGNIIAKYTLGPGQSAEVSVDLLANVRYINYDLAKGGTPKDIPANLVSQYTKPTKYWQSDNPEIQAKAKELIQGKNTVAEQVRAINDYVIQTLDYNNEKIKYNIRQGALKAYQEPTNVVCLEYSDLTIALLRAAKIPSRMPVGYGYSGDLKLSPAVSDSLHSWVEAYIPNVGWINLDPTWGEKFNNFGVSDIDHFTFAIWGADDSKPFPIAENGSDTNYQYEKTTLSYVVEIPKPSNDAKLKFTKWVILPFISIGNYEIQAPSNSATYNLEINLIDKGSSKSKNIGSTAPAQKISGALTLLGMNFADQSTAKLFEQNSKEALATTAVSVNYAPLLIIASIVSVIIIAWVVKLLSKKKTIQLKHEKTEEPDGQKSEK